VIDTEVTEHELLHDTPKYVICAPLIFTFMNRVRGRAYDPNSKTLPYPYPTNPNRKTALTLP